MFVLRKKYIYKAIKKRENEFERNKIWKMSRKKGNKQRYQKEVKKNERKRRRVGFSRERREIKKNGES